MAVFLKFSENVLWGYVHIYFPETLFLLDKKFNSFCAIIHGKVDNTKIIEFYRSYGFESNVLTTLPPRLYVADKSYPSYN